MPIHCNSQLIFKSINSLLNQSYKMFNIYILIDGENNILFNSINKKYSEQIFNNKILIFHFKKKIGLTKILNFAIKNTKSEYIARNDYDDFSEKDRLMLQIKKLEENKNLNMVYSYFNFVDIRGNLIRKKRPSYTGFNLKKKLCVMNPIAHSTVMFKRKFIQRIGSYNENYRVSQDFELWSRIINNNIENIGVIQKKLLDITIHQKSVSSQKSIEQRMNSILICFNNKIFPRSINKIKIDSLSYSDKLYYQSLNYAYLYEKNIKLSTNYKFFTYLFQIYLLHPSLLYKKIKFKLL